MACSNYINYSLKSSAKTISWCTNAPKFNVKPTDTLEVYLEPDWPRILRFLNS